MLARKAQDVLLADPGTQDMFDDRVYKRGALTVHAVRVLLGDAAFFDAVRSYLAEGRHGVVTPENLLAKLRERAEDTAALDGLLEQWLEQEQLPHFPA